MKARLKLKPGQRGTKKLLAEYGEKLLCVRYRYDKERKKRVKTVELIVEETDWQPADHAPKQDTLVGIRVAFEEVELQGKVKMAGGRWNKKKRVWEIRYDRAVGLGLEDRIVNL